MSQSANVTEGGIYASNKYPLGWILVSAITSSLQEHKLTENK